MLLSFIHGVTGISFLWLNNTPLCVYMCAYVCAYICTHHTHITLSLPPHLLMDNWIGSMSWLCEPHCSEHGEAQSSHQDDYCISFEYMPRSGIAGPHDSSTFNFLRNTILFPQWLHQFIFPPTVPEFFFHILDNTGYLLSFWEQPSWQVWGDGSLSTWLALFWWLEMLSTFSVLDGHLCVLHQNVYSGPLPIFKSDYLFFSAVELHEFLTYFGYYPLYLEPICSVSMNGGFFISATTQSLCIQRGK